MNMKKIDGRVLALELAVLAGVAVSAWNLKSFIEGMMTMQDLWNGSDYVRLLLQGLVAAGAGVAAAEALRRVDKNYKDGLGTTFVFIARAMLVIQVFALLYCNSGPVRGIVYTIFRVLATYGMARDLPEPPPSV